MRGTAAALSAIFLAAASSGVAEALELRRPSLLGDADASPAVPMPGMVRELAPAAGVVDIDLSAEFPDAATRHQGSIGDCHAFAAVGVLEAAWFRSRRKHRTFSEADLFFGRTVLTGDVYEPFVERGDADFKEGNSVSADVRYALANGVSSSGEYAKTARRYVRMSEGQKRVMETLAKNAAGMPAGDLGNIWAKFVQSPLMQDSLSKVGGLNGGRVSEEREEARRGFAGFKQEDHSFPYLGQQALATSASECARLGEPQRRRLLEELRAGRPVAVGMTLAGLPEWGMDARKHAEHGFVIVGARGPEPAATFPSRNSWGGLNPPVRAEQLCRVHSITSVLAPGERARRPPMN